MFSTEFTVALAVALAVTVGFSMFNHPLRGYRNLGILACYVIGIAMAVSVELNVALATWLLFGLSGGVAYFLYDWLAWVRSDRSDPEDNGHGVSPSHLLFGLIAWPIMLPEAIEYTLAEFGFLSNGQVDKDDPANDGKETQ